MDASLISVAVVAAVALLAPLALGLAGIRLAAIALEILLGIVVGPQGLGWAQLDEPVRVLALAFLLLLSGPELDLERVRRRWETARSRPEIGSRAGAWRRPGWQAP